MCGVFGFVFDGLHARRQVGGPIMAESRGVFVFNVEASPATPARAFLARVFQCLIERGHVVVPIDTPEVFAAVDRVLEVDGGLDRFFREIRNPLGKRDSLTVAELGRFQRFLAELRITAIGDDRLRTIYGHLVLLVEASEQCERMVSFEHCLPTAEELREFAAQGGRARAVIQAAVDDVVKEDR
jgi:hypothetical protein